MKRILPALALLLVPVSVLAQVANVSRTDAAITGVNINTLAVSAPSNTYMPNDGRTLLVVKNSSGSPVTATLVTQRNTLTADGYGSVDLSNEAVGVPSASTVLIGPFPQGRWSTASGVVHVSMSDVAGVSVTSVRVPR